MRIALIQMPVLPDKVKNIQTACGKIREAAKNGADFAVLPEMFCCPYDNRCFGAYGEPEGGEAQTALSHLAAELGLYLVGGTVPELSEGRIYNTSYVYGPDGRQLAKHRKAHLFDIDVQGGQRFRESDTLSPGNAITTFETAFGTMGLCVCFDLRFEELARCMCLRGAKVIFVPAAFNMTTGPAHSGQWTTSASPWGSPPPGTNRAPTWPTATPSPWIPGAPCSAGLGRRRQPCTRTWTWNGWRRYGPSCPSSPPGGRICMRCGRSERHSLRRIL